MTCLSPELKWKYNTGYSVSDNHLLFVDQGSQATFFRQSDKFDFIYVV